MAQEYQAIVAIAKDVILSSCAIIGAYVAVSGVKAWKKQLIGKTDYELARRILTATYKVRDAIKQFRNPFIFHRKSPEPKAKDEGEDDFEKSAYDERWARLVDTWANLELEILDADVTWGRGKRQKFKELEKCVRLLRSSISKHLLNKQGGRFAVKLSVKQIEEIDEVIYDVGSEDEPDSFQQKVDKAIEGIEEFVKPHMKL